MPKNNYFNYTDHHYDFLYYLLSFAMEQYQDEEPLLSGCAKELIRYILGMDETESVVVTDFDIFAVTVNHNKFIQFNSSFMFYPSPEQKENFKDWYFVCYDPSAFFDIGKYEELHIMYLPMKKLKEICGKYQSKNQIFLQHIQYLEEQLSLIEVTMQTPINQWKEDDYKRFVLHLAEDSVIDLTGRIDGVRVLWEGNPRYTRGLHWYFISDDDLEKMGVRNHIDAIYLHTRVNTINICFEPSSEDDDLYVKKLKSFVKNICPMPIFFDLSDYKEKIQYAESTMDQLVAEFKL